MTNKQVLQNKVTHLESLLLESSLVQEGLANQLEIMQNKIDSYKKSKDPKELEQNNELIMQLIQSRLDLGKETYHQNIPIMPKDDITRDNFYEAVQEALDLSVYLAAYMLRLMEEKERREGEPTTADEHNNVNHGPPFSTAQANALDEKRAKNDKIKESTT